MAYDGPQVFLAPYANEDAQEDFTRTALEGVPESTVAAHSSTYPAGDPVRAWGTKETVRSWNNVEAGDYLLFYQEGTYDNAAEVINTEKNEPLGRELWPNHEESKPWSQIIYIHEPVSTSIDSDEIHDLAGHDREFPQGFSRLNEMGVGGIRGRYGSVEELVRDGSSIDYSPERYGDPPDITTVPEVDVPESALESLYFPGEQADDIIDQVNSALNAGKHLVFTGPPGTGKTEIARLVCRHLISQHSEIYTGHQITTATADWSTFETVGGYMPDEAEGDDLSFEPGQVLRRYKRDDRQLNELLVIDEINRADIDKAFGQLFTVLSGQGVQLPYKRDGAEIEILPAAEADDSLESHQYRVPSSWRIFATMNSYDKTSLYELSYAFMRRFAFIHVRAPEIPEDPEARVDLVGSYADTWGIERSDDVFRDIGNLWFAVNALDDGRKIGPAIIEDVLTHVMTNEVDRRVSLTQAVSNYVFPQLEGVPNRQRIVSRIAETGSIDRRRFDRLAADVLDVRVDG